MIFSFPFDDASLIDVEIEECKKAVRLASKQFGVTISMIVVRQTARDPKRLQDFCELAISLGAKGVKFIRLMPVSPRLLDKAPTSEEARHILLEIAVLKRRYARDLLTLQTPGCFGLFEFRRSLAPRRFANLDLSQVYDCPAGIRNFVISVDNRVYPCLYLMTDVMQIGTFRNSEIIIMYPERAGPRNLQHTNIGF